MWRDADGGHHCEPSTATWAIVVVYILIAVFALVLFFRFKAAVTRSVMRGLAGFTSMCLLLTCMMVVIERATNVAVMICDDDYYDVLLIVLTVVIALESFATYSSVLVFGFTMLLSVWRSIRLSRTSRFDRRLLAITTCFIAAISIALILALSISHRGVILLIMQPFGALVCCAILWTASAQLNRREASRISGGTVHFKYLSSMAFSIGSFWLSIFILLTGYVACTLYGRATGSKAMAGPLSAIALTTLRIMHIIAIFQQTQVLRHSFKVQRPQRSVVSVGGSRPSTGDFNFIAERRASGAESIVSIEDLSPNQLAQLMNQPPSAMRLTTQPFSSHHHADANMTPTDSYQVLRTESFATSSRLTPNDDEKRTDTQAGSRTELDFDDAATDNDDENEMPQMERVMNHVDPNRTRSVSAASITFGRIPGFQYSLNTLARSFSLQLPRSQFDAFSHDPSTTQTTTEATTTSDATSTTATTTSLPFIAPIQPPLPALLSRTSTL
jgi:hypothetical protein